MFRNNQHNKNNQQPVSYKVETRTSDTAPWKAAGSYRSEIAAYEQFANCCRSKVGSIRIVKVDPQQDRPDVVTMTSF